MAARGKIAGKLGKNIKKAASKQEYGPYLQVLIPAGEAVAAPPLGPQLAQVIKHKLVWIKRGPVSVNLNRDRVIYKGQLEPIFNSQPKCKSYIFK